MSWYRTLGPITYVDGNTVVTLDSAGARVDLTPSQASSLAGQVVFDGTNQYTYPKSDVLFFQYFVLFPTQGVVGTIYFAADLGQFYQWSDDTVSYVPAGVPTGWVSIDTDERDDVTVGESTMSRRYITGSGVVSDGVLTLAYFTARQSETITQIKTLTGSQGQVGATLCRQALYSVDDAGNLALEAACSSDTTLWATPNTAYTSSLSASYNTVRGNRYALGVLTYGTSTPASFTGAVTIPSLEAMITPALCGQVAGLADLPSTILVSNLEAAHTIPYGVVLP